MRLAVIIAAGLALGCLLPSTRALDNGIGLRPALGYNTWNCFGPHIDEELIKTTADLMVSLGLSDVGYEYLVLDDAWSEMSRGPDGRLISNQARFPSGMKALGEYIHGKGLKFGIYSDAGEFTCQHFPGSRGREETDAQTWAEWGVDYLKYDNCYAPAEDWVVNRFSSMRDALNKTGRPILYSLCEWGVADPWLWAPEVGNSWRTVDDIVPTWESILTRLDNSVGLARYAGPGAFNDLDMLEVGNGALTVNQQRSHFALWALLKSPLLIGTDLRNISASSLAILKAREVLAVHQDPLGVPGDLVWKRGSKEIYAAPLSDGGRAVVFLNRETDSTQYPTAHITVHWEQLGLEPSARAVVRDLYAEKDLGEFARSFTGAVGLHDVAALRITPLLGAQRSTAWRPWHGQPMYAYYAKDSRVAPPEALEMGAGLGRRAGMGPKGASGSTALAAEM